MRQFIFDPLKSGDKLTIVCFVSGSGTNYREIVRKDPSHNYVVFTNRPGCGGEVLARENGHPIIELSHIPFLEQAKKRYGAGNVPRNCAERVGYEQEIFRLLEGQIGRKADLICLAGYDQWLTDWFVDKYYPRILNVHPGDTLKGYDGLYWIPTAKAVIAGDEAIKSSLFIVDKGEDTGPVLVQSEPLEIAKVIAESENGLAERFKKVTAFIRTNNIKTYDSFKATAGSEIFEIMKQACEVLQNALKIAGDWKIYPFAVHDLIARGRVEVNYRKIYVDGKLLPPQGYKIDQQI
jgi:folate-dependent phosphoribosylglycinamide formyltransferase PurN